MNILTEATRSELINKSANADKTKSYGTTRYERRNHVHVFGEVNALNKLDMNALFKGNMLSFLVPIHGETNDYNVEVLFEGICDDIKEEIKKNNNKCEYKCVYRAIINTINRQDIYVACDCPDWKMRMSYWATKGRYNGGRPEVRASDITNPNDTKGAGCKHVMNIIGNLDWAMKLATCINNYISYMRENYEQKYAEFIHPAIYDMSYQKAVQLGLFGDDQLADTMPNKDSEGNYTDVDTSEIDDLYDPAVEEPEVDVEEPRPQEDNQQQLDLEV